MTDNEKNSTTTVSDDEIVKALKICTSSSNGCSHSNYTCDDCYLKGQPMCLAVLHQDTIDLINRRQADKEALIAGQKTLQKSFVEEIERLKKDLKVSTEDVRKAQTSIIKKFWKELKKRNYGNKGIIPISCGAALVVKTINSIMCGKYDE